MTCDECRTMLATPNEEPPQMAERLGRSPLMKETKRSVGNGVPLEVPLRPALEAGELVRWKGVLDAPGRTGAPA